MSAMTVEQRGDLAETMLPVAANLAVLVHGDGGPEDVAQVLAGLDETQKNALIVVLAGLVDPEQPVGKALGWLDFNEHGCVVVPSWSEEASVRDLAPEVEVETDDEYVDQNAVDRFIKGFRVEVTDADFLAAVQQCVALEMTLADVDRLRRWPAKTAEKWVNRIRKRYQRSGRVFPSLAPPTARVFTEQEVIAMRERAAEGATDLEIAMSFDTFANTVGAIVRGVRYRQFGGPLRKARSVEGVSASRQFMCGHADNSREGTRHHQLGTAA
ncbi:hypothetical protein [Streptomyces sp. NBC_00847]|uniref:hypothetical protein n=1 Tax=Streptomyces sp. NBC_00847 TaxID=2975850 RepID=UPI00225DD885|nr:hypothetical protein [Streptomyces sp. NBC_00847]MCX4885934.1 hypothetical protein [Streptomyces sp. NBC_00847]